MLFPPSCGGCGKLGSRWCSDCQQKLVQVPMPICEICGAPQKNSGICRECQHTRPRFSQLRSCAVYKDPARAVLLKIKYHHERWLGEAIAWSLAGFLDDLDWQADLVIQVPLSKQRMAERGYNQVDLIAHPLARIMDWHYSPTALHRARHTASQVGLGPSQRRINVRGAFLAESRIVESKTLLLVDDTTTTGSTLDSAAGALMDAGASKVYALTFAKALPKNFSNFERQPSHPIFNE